MTAPAPVAVEEGLVERWRQLLERLSTKKYSSWALELEEVANETKAFLTVIEAEHASALSSLQVQVEAHRKDASGYLDAVVIERTRAEAAEAEVTRLRQRVEELEGDAEGMRMFLAGHPTFSLSDFAEMDKMLAADRARTKEPNNV